MAGNADRLRLPGAYRLQVGRSSRSRDPRDRQARQGLDDFRAAHEKRPAAPGSALERRSPPARRVDLDGSSGLLFPSPRGKALSDATMSKMLRTLGVDAVPHGFRSSFRDWASEVQGADREVAEIALAHMPYGGAEAAYARSDLLERRRVLMQKWCDYLELDRPTPG